MVERGKAPNEDFLVRGTIGSRGIRLTLTHAANLVNRGVLLHDADPAGAFFFGRSLLLGALFSPLLVDAEKYFLRWEYEGVLGTVLVDVNAHGHVRGLPKVPQLTGLAADEASLYGKGGTITVIKADQGKILNSGSSKAALLDIVSDMAFHLSVSDQVETEIRALVRFQPDTTRPVSRAVGLMIQAMPGCDMEYFSVIRSRMNGAEFDSVLMEGMLDPEARLERLIKNLTGDADSGPDGLNEDVHYTFTPPPAYVCSCSEGRMKEMLLTLLEPPDLEKLLEEEGAASVTCHFCRTEYRFSRDELPVRGGAA